MRIVSILIPYYLQDDKLFVLMQLRSLDAERIPGYISFFGGGVDEGETPDQGLIREIKEELDLDLDLDQVEPFHKYEFYETVNHFYLLTVEPGWQPPQVLEGEAAVWLNSQEVFEKSNITLKDKVVINDLERHFLNKPIR